MEERGLDVVPREAPGHLGEVVGPEGEERGRVGDLGGGERRARHLDHRADEDVELDAALLEHRREDLLGLLADRLQLLHRPDQRDHDLRPRVAAGLLALGGRLGDRPHLHGEQPLDHQAQPHAAQAEHRVLLVQPADGGQQPQVGLVRVPLGLGDGDPHREVGEVGQELVQRRVEQPHGHRQPVHRLEDLQEVLLLQRRERVEGGLLALVVLGEDQLLHQLPPVAEEHVLGAAQADAAGAEAPGAG